MLGGGGGGLQVPSKTSTLIQQNRERLDNSGEEHWSPAASKGHPCPNGGWGAPPPFFSHSFTLLAGPRISNVSFWPCAALSQWMSLDRWEAPPKTAAAGSLVLYCTSAYTVKLLYSQHSSTFTSGLLFHKSNTCICTKILLGVLRSVFTASFAACLYSLLSERGHMQLQCTHNFSSTAHMSNCDKWVNSSTEQPRIPSCVSLELSQKTASTVRNSKPQSGGKETFTSGTAVNMLPH